MQASMHPSITRLSGQTNAESDDDHLHGKHIVRDYQDARPAADC
jgi:hypothetical protein